MKHLTASASAVEIVAHPPRQPRIQSGVQIQYSSHEKVLTMIGVLLVMLLASLDSTIVSTALPRIVADLQGFDRYTWISTAYLLTSTVTVPIYGELSDQIGRKPIFLFGVIVFLLGSVLSGASQTMTQLIIFRAFQGIGAGALLPIAIAIVGDLFTPRERGRWQGVTGAVFGISSVTGPTIGGWITQHAPWRWVFYVNLPIGIVALLALIFLMPRLRGHGQRVSIDYTGAALLVLGTVPLLLGFTWAGTQYSWFSPQILGLFVFSVLVLIGFVFYELRVERRGDEPILEPTLFKNSVVSVSILVSFAFGMSLFGSVFFIPLFVQGVVGTSATASGLILTPLMLTSIVGSVIVGQLVARWGRYKVLAIAGMVFSVLGSALLLRLNVSSTSNDVLLAMLVLGVGLGFASALYTLIVQNALPTRIGQATAALTFFRSIGGTIGLAVMGSLMNAAYLPTFTRALPAQARQVFPPSFLAAFNNPQVLLSAAAQAQLRVAAARFGPQGVPTLSTVLDGVKLGLADGIHTVFILSFVVMTIGLVAVVFLKDIPLGSARKVAVAQKSVLPEARVVPEAH